MNKINNNKEYKDIFKISFSYGLLQVFQIAVNLIKTKCIAIILGPSGVGLNNLFQSGTGVIASIVNNGLTTSAVKEITLAESSLNNYEAGLKISAFKKLLVITGILGFAFCFVLAPFLSHNTFNSYNYIISFQVLSLSVLLNQLSGGFGVLLRSRRLTRRIIVSTVVSSIFSLIATLPLFYLFKFNGMVPAIVITSCINLVVLKYYSRDQVYQSVKLSLLEAILIGKSMMSSGFLISLSTLFASIISYIFISFLSRKSSSNLVGLYTAGFAILNTYVGLIFNAMAQDFYPRLSSKIENKNEAYKLISYQIEISILIISPLLVVMILFNKLLINIMYTGEFLVISPMIVFASLGILCKVLAWAVSFYLLASGKIKVYFYLELVVLIYSLVCNLFFFESFGLTGLGISSSLNLIIASVIYLIVANLSFNRPLIIIFIFNFVFISSTIFFSILHEDKFSIYFKLLILLFVSLFNIKILLKKLRFDLFVYLVSIFK